LAVPVAVALARALGAALVAFGVEVLLHLQLHHALGQHPHALAPAQERLRRPRTGGGEVLAVVEHEQQLPPPERRHQGQDRWRGAMLLHTQGGGDSRRDQVGVAEAGEFDQPHLHGGRLRQGSSHRQGQPGLADAAGTGQCDQPGAIEQMLDRCRIPLPPDEAGERVRQVGCRQRGVEAAPAATGAGGGP